MKKIIALLLSLSMFSGVAFAEDSMKAEGVKKVVIQVSTADETVQKIALNNAVNLQKALGPDGVDVEIVAYGPGMSLLTGKSAQAKRVPDLAMQEITFSACANTMKKIEKKTGKKPTLVEGVKVVPAGVLRIVELQEQGYSYIRP